MRPDPDDKPVLPTLSDEEAGIGWGEAPEAPQAPGASGASERDDDERLRRDRPPHWDQ